MPSEHALHVLVYYSDAIMNVCVYVCMYVCVYHFRFTLSSLNRTILGQIGLKSRILCPSEWNFSKIIHHQRTPVCFTYAPICLRPVHDI